MNNYRENLVNAESKTWTFNFLGKIMNFPETLDQQRVWNIICPYSVRMRENTAQKNSQYGHFSRSVGS